MLLIMSFHSQLLNHVDYCVNLARSILPSKSDLALKGCLAARNHSLSA